MENINLELYKVFYYVAINKNITKAANILLISQPAITQSIKKLEDEIGYKLFYRTSKGVELTSYGEELLENIKNPIEKLNNSRKKLEFLDKQEIKSIRIGGGTILLKHNAISGFKKFNKKYPNIKLEITRGITSELFEKLNNDMLDLVLYNMPAEINENTASYEIEKVQDIFVANSKSFPELMGKKINLKDLSSLPFVLQSEVSSSRKFLNSICTKHNIQLNDKYELESYELVLAFVKAGLGVGFINKNHIKQELKKRELFELDIDYKIPSRIVGVAINKKNNGNKYLMEFIKMIRK